ncbi:MAG TPA: hypothetical protein VF868_00820 [Bacteroidia bacterium]|jgi:hypothetical protein
MRALIFFLLFSINCNAQEFLEMNDRAFTGTGIVVNKHPVSSGIIPVMFYIKEQSLYNPKNDRITRNILSETGDKEILRLIAKAKKNRKREFIAFAALPLGIFAAACIRGNNMNFTMSKPAGITFLAASLSCIIVSPIANYRKTSNYRKAVRLYNQQYL